MTLITHNIHGTGYRLDYDTQPAFMDHRPPQGPPASAMGCGEPPLSPTKSSPPSRRPRPQRHNQALGPSSSQLIIRE